MATILFNKEEKSVLFKKIETKQKQKTNLLFYLNNNTTEINMGNVPHNESEG